MSGFDAIDLDKMPAPQIIDRMDFETILQESKDDMLLRDPGLEAVLSLESEPITKIMENWAYREMRLRAEVDDAGRGLLLAFASGATLDHLAAFFGVERLVVQVEDLDAVPPVPELLEDDDRLRRRVQLAPEGYTAGGSPGSYVFWGLTASDDVKDIGVDSPVSGTARVTVLAKTGNGLPGAALLDLVEETLEQEPVRQLCALVVVQAVTVIDYDVEAVLTMKPGPDSEVVRLASVAAVETYVEENHRLGHDITISGLHAALHQQGVQKVDLVSPAADIVVTTEEAAYCGTIDVTVGGVDV